MTCNEMRKPLCMTISPSPPVEIVSDTGIVIMSVSVSPDPLVTIVITF